MKRFEIVDSWFTPTVLFCIINLMIAVIFFLKPHEKLKKLTEAQHLAQLVRVPLLFQRVRSVNRSTYRSDPQPDPAHQQTYPTAHEEQIHEYADESRGHATRSKSGTVLKESEPVQEYDEEDRSHVTRRSKSGPIRKEMEPIHEYDGEDRSHVTGSKSDTIRKETEPVDQETYPAAREEPVHKYDEGRSHVRSKSDMVRKEMKPVKKVLKKSFSEKLKVEAEELVDLRRPATMREKTTASQGDEAVDAKADDFISRFRKQLKLQRLDSVNLRYTEMMNRGTGGSGSSEV